MQLKYSTPKEITITFHNGSNYDYHFIKKLVAEKYKGQSSCLEENTEKYINFLAPIEKEIKRKGEN